MNTGLIGVAVAIAATAPLMGLFLPPLYEVRSGTTVIRKDGFRQTVLIGGGLSVVVAILASAASGSPLPIVGAFMAVAIIAGTYEWALENPIGGV